jgi:hypothetical protein
MSNPINENNLNCGIKRLSMYTDQLTSALQSNPTSSSTSSSPTSTTPSSPNPHIPKTDEAAMYSSRQIPLFHGKLSDRAKKVE